MSMSIPQCIILEIPENSVNDSIYVYEWVFLEIPVDKLHRGNVVNMPYLKMA